MAMRNRLRAAVLLCVMALFCGAGYLLSRLAQGPRGEERAAGPGLPQVAATRVVEPASMGGGRAEQGGAEPGEKEGLTLFIEAASPRITPEENIRLKVTYQNRSAGALRFPSGGSGLTAALFHLEDVKTGVIYTAGHDRFMNGAPRLRPETGRAPKPTDPPIAGPQPALAPGESRTTEMSTFVTMGFYPGDWGTFAEYSEGRKALSRGQTWVNGGYSLDFSATLMNVSPIRVPFPPGRYRLRLTVEFPAGDQEAGGANLAPLWNGGTIRSNAVEMEVTDLACQFEALAPGAGVAAGTGWISGKVVDGEGKPAGKTSVLYFGVTDLQSPPKPVAAGSTDEQGRYTIKDLPPGRYMVIAGGWHMPGDRWQGNEPPLVNGSMQPILVKGGAETQLADPIQIKAETRNNVGGGSARG